MAAERIGYQAISKSITGKLDSLKGEFEGLRERRRKLETLDPYSSIDMALQIVTESSQIQLEEERIRRAWMRKERQRKLFEQANKAIAEDPQFREKFSRLSKMAEESPEASKAAEHFRPINMVIGIMLRQEAKMVGKNKPKENLHVDEQTIEGDEAQMINLLWDSAPKAIVTLRKLREEFPGRSDSEIIELVNRSRMRLPEGLSVDEVENPKNEHAFYVDKHHEEYALTMVGDGTIKTSRKRNIDPNEGRLLKRLYYNGVKKNKPCIFIPQLAKEYYPDALLEGPSLIRGLIVRLGMTLEQATGRDDLLVMGGNQDFGYFARLKDIRIRSVSNEISEAKLKALAATFDSADDIPGIISKLGTTKKGEIYKRQWAWAAIRGFYNALIHRMNAGEATEEEKKIFSKIKLFLVEKKIKTSRQVDDFLRERFDIKPRQEKSDKLVE